MWSPWTWLRRKAQEAVLGGVADALQEITGDDKPLLTLQQLQQQLALPDREEKGKKKAA